MELASSDAMAARDALPVLNVLFLFLAVRNRSFLSGRERKERFQKESGRTLVAHKTQTAPDAAASGVV